MSKATILKNIFTRFNPATAKRYLDYFWKNGEVAQGGKLVLPEESLRFIKDITEKTGFSPATLRMMARDRLKLSNYNASLESLPYEVQSIPKVAKIMNRDWSSRLPKGWRRTNHYGHELSPQLKDYELDELRNHFIQPQLPFPKIGVQMKSPFVKYYNP